MVYQLRPGDILLTRSNGAVGWLIRFGERIRAQGWLAALAWLAKRIVGVHQPDTAEEPWYVNHAAVCVAPGHLVEALAAGLTLSPVAKYDGRAVIVVPLSRLLPGVTDTERARVAAYARTQLANHDRYGWLSICSIILQLITPFRLDISWDGALICSAFAAMCAEHAGYTLPTRSALTTMPSEIRMFQPQPPATLGVAA